MPDPFHQIVYEQPAHRPIWWLGYLVGALLTIFSPVILCVGSGAVAIGGLPPAAQTVDPPGTLSISIDKPGTMVIWVERPDTPSRFAAAPEVPGDLKAKVIGPDAQTIPTRTPKEETTSTRPDAERIGAFLFDAPASGTYTIDVKGTFPDGDVICVTPDQGSREIAVGLGVMVCLALGIVMFIGGLATMIITGVKHARYRQE